MPEANGRWSPNDLKVELKYVWNHKEIMTALPLSLDANQNMIGWSCRWGNEFPNDGDGCSRSVKSFWRVKNPPGGSLQRFEPRSPLRNQLGSLTCWLRVYGCPLLRVQLWCPPDGHHSWLWMMYTESMSPTNDLWLQNVFYRACRRTVQWL